MPIFDKQGRPCSTRTIDENETVLLSDIERLPEDEKFAVLEMYAQLQSGDTEDFAHAATVEYTTVPVDVRTFLTHPYFLGESGGALWPQLVEDMVELFEGHYHEIALGGSLGWGKSFFSTTALAYVLYQMSCLRNPQQAYGLAPGSHIYLAMLSRTEKVVRRVAINELLGKITHSRYFKEHFSHEAAPSNLEIRFPNQIQIVGGSTGSSAIIGLNAFAGFVDESSFMGDTKEIDRSGRLIVVDKGEAIYKSIIRRMKSRFQKVGRLPGIMILASSKERPIAFVEQRIQQAREQGDPNFFVREYATWDVKPKEAFTGKFFRIAAGNERYPSRILSGDVAEENKYLDLGLRVVDVPEEYRPDFERDLDGALRDVAGVATQAVSPYMQRPDRLYAAIDDTLVNPIGGPDSGEAQEEWMSGTPLVIEWGRIARAFARRLPGGYTETAWSPIRNPSVTRYAHIDPSLTGDSTGMAIGHISGWTEVVRRDPMGNEYNELAPIVETDLLLRIMPPPGDEILLSDVRSILYQFQEHGFHIGFVSMDSYQCLAASTLVHTSRGILPIEDVEIGDLVQSRSGPNKVTNRWSYGRRDTVRIATQDGDVLEATRQHRIEVQIGWTSERQTEWGWTRDPVWEWSEAGMVRVGDVVRVCDSPTELDPPDEELLGSKTELGWRGGGVRNSTIDSWEFPNKVTVELAEWLGLIWGDGQVQRDGVRLTVTAEEADDADDAKLVFESLFGTLPTYRPTTDLHGTISVSARWLTRWMAMNDLCKPEIPGPIMRSSKAAKAAFLRGLFAADGNVGRGDGHVSLSTKHRTLADQVRLVLRVDFGIESCLTTIERGKPGDYVDHGKQYVIGLRGPRRRFADLIGFSYSRKEAELHKHLGVVGRRKFVRVVDVCESSAEVFDLEVDRDPSYVANGFINHNSADALQQLRKRGIEAEVVSVDRTTEPYDMLKTALYEGRIRMHRHAWCIRELSQLQRVPRPHGGFKIDHPKLGADGKPGCLAGDTMVSLLDGREVSIRDLAEESVDQVYVYTIRDDKVSVGHAYAPRLTSRDAETVIVELDNGGEVCCTPDHRFMLRDGSYREASALRSGDSLMPLYRRVPEKRDSGGMVGYERYRCPGDSRWHYTHRMVGKWKYGSEYTGNQHGSGLIHHEAGKRNNDPGKLLLVSAQEHGKLHADNIRARRSDHVFEDKRRTAAVAYARSEGGREFSRQNMLKLQADPKFRSDQRLRSGAIGKITGPRNLTAYNKSEAHRHTASEVGKRTIWKAIEAQHGKPHHWSIGNRNVNARTDVTIDAIRTVSEPMVSLAKVARKLKCDASVVRRILREAGTSWASFSASLGENHRVVSVRPGPRTDVYDLSVMETENFALTVGVFVHNSKDVADALASLVFNLTQRTPGMPIAPQLGATDRERVAAEDNSWVTDGRSVVQLQETGRARPGKGIVGSGPGSDQDFPMPFIKG